MEYHVHGCSQIHKVISLSFGYVQQMTVGPPLIAGVLRGVCTHAPREINTSEVFKSPSEYPVRAVHLINYKHDTALSW